MSMVVDLIQFGEWIFADDDWAVDIRLDDSRNQFQANPTVTDRAGASPFLSPGSLTPRIIPAKFIYSGSGDTLDAIATMAGKLMLDDLAPKRLLGLTGDGARVQIMASISPASGWNQNLGAQVVHTAFTAGSARWEATNLTTVSGVFSDAGQFPALAIPNAGYATVEPTITIQPSVTNHLATSADVGWRYRRQWTMTNTGDNAWDRPLRLDMGDTTVWVTDGALASGNDLRIQLNGEELPRTLVAWNYGQSFVWINPPSIASGETVTIDAIYGNASAGSPAVLTKKLHPSFIYEYAKGTATASSTTTKLNDTSQAWNLTDINWIGGSLTMISGTVANKGISREITALTTNSVTVGTAFPAAIATGDKYLITHSSNARWWQNVGKWFDDSSPTPVRGLWYLDKRDRQPTDIDFDTPGSWRPYAMADNQDRFAQRSRTKVAGAYFAFLDAYRSWQGGGARGQLTDEDGIADGVMLQSSIPILGLRRSYSLSNNLNGMGQQVVMARAGGAEGWETIDSAATAGSSSDDDYLTLPVDSPYFAIYKGLLPSDDEGVIRPDRARDAGSATADGAARTIHANSSGGPFTFKQDANSGSASVKDSSDATIAIPNSTTMELAGGNKGSWREVIYTNGSDQYTGWIALANLDTGSTAGGDTIVDGSKNWATNELTGASIKVTGSNNAALVGKVHTVASNTATTITVTAAFGATVIQGTAYETIQPKTTVHLQDGALSWVDFDATSISISAVSAKQDVYQVAAELSVGDGGPALFERKVSTRIGLDGRRVFLRTADQLILDGTNRKATIVDGSGNLISALTDPAVLIQQVTQDPINHRQVTKRAARWTPLGMGANIVSGGDAEAGVVDFFMPVSVAGLAIAIDPTTPLTGTKSYLLDVDAGHTGPIGTIAVIAALDDAATPTVRPGQRIQFSTGLRVTNANLRAQLGVRWLNNLGNEISSSYADDWIPVINTWYRVGCSAIFADFSNPAIPWTDPEISSAIGSGAIVFAQPVIKLVAITANPVGQLRWDAFDYGSPILWYAETGGNAVGVTVDFHAGYLG